MSLTPSLRRQITAPLLSRESIGKAYHVLTFDVPQGVEAGPGQFCMVRGAEWGAAPLLPRPMSYLTAGTTPSILIKVFGDGTRRLAHAEPGEHFTLLGPLGNTWPAPTAGLRPVLVAGGVGIAPLLFFAKLLNKQGLNPIALYGGRSVKDLPLEDELARVCEVHITTEDGSFGHHGRVTDVLGDHLNGAVQVFTCGPDRMMASVARVCAERDVPCIASLETPMACGYGVCLGCPVPTVEDRYLYACVDGPCIDASRINWNTPAHAPKSVSAVAAKGATK